MHRCALACCAGNWPAANFPWVIFPFLGWGIGLTFHYVYGYRRAADAARLRQRHVAEYAADKELV